LRFIYHFKLADAVPLDGKISYKELSEKAGVDEKRVKTIIRYAMTNNIFREPKAGYVAHTAGSSLFVKQKGVRDWVGYTSEETYPASAKLVEATKKWGASGDPRETAYNLAFDTRLPMFEHMAQSPERGERFANVMIEMTSTDGYNIRHLVNGFDWEGLEDGATVVDVGFRLADHSTRADVALPTIGWWVHRSCK
jgi:6-hydroxytryprostatin B O-methyltransferase